MEMVKSLTEEESNTKTKTAQYFLTNLESTSNERLLNKDNNISQNELQF